MASTFSFSIFVLSRGFGAEQSVCPESPRELVLAASPAAKATGVAAAIGRSLETVDSTTWRHM